MMEVPDLIDWVRTHSSDFASKTLQYGSAVASDAVALVHCVRDVFHLILELEKEILSQPSSTVQPSLQAVYHACNEASEALSSCEKVGALSSIVRAVDLHSQFGRVSAQLLLALSTLPAQVVAKNQGAVQRLQSELGAPNFPQLAQLEEWNEELRELLSRRATRKKGRARLCEMVPSLLEHGCAQADLDLVKSDLVVAEAVEDDDDRSFLKGLLRTLESLAESTKVLANIDTAASTDSTPHASTLHSQQSFSSMAPVQTVSPRSAHPGLSALRSTTHTATTGSSRHSQDEEQNPVQSALRQHGGVGEEAHRPGSVVSGERCLPEDGAVHAGARAETGSVKRQHDRDRWASQVVDKSDSFDQKSSSGEHSTIPARLWCPEEEEDTAHTPNINPVLHDSTDTNNSMSSVGDERADIARPAPALAVAHVRGVGNHEHMGHGDVASTSGGKGVLEREAEGEAADVADSVNEEVEAPPELLDPMTCMLMLDPVILVETGMTFDRPSIEKWLAKAGHADPSTGAPLQCSPLLVPNVLVKRMVDHWVEQHTHNSQPASQPSQRTAKPSQPTTHKHTLTTSGGTSVNVHEAPSPVCAASDQDTHLQKLTFSLTSPVRKAIQNSEHTSKAGVRERALDTCDLKRTQAAEADGVVGAQHCHAPGNDNGDIPVPVVPHSTPLREGSTIAMPPATTVVAIDVAPGAVTSKRLVTVLRTAENTLTPRRLSLRQAAEGTPSRSDQPALLSAPQQIDTAGCAYTGRNATPERRSAPPSLVSTPDRGPYDTGSRSVHTTPLKQTSGTGTTPVQFSRGSSAATTPERYYPSAVGMPAHTPDRAPGISMSTPGRETSHPSNATDRALTGYESTPSRSPSMESSRTSMDESSRRRSRYASNRFSQAMEILNHEPKLGNRRTTSNSSLPSSAASDTAAPNAPHPTMEANFATSATPAPAAETKMPTDSTQPADGTVAISGMKLVDLSDRSENRKLNDSSKGSASIQKESSVDPPRLSARGWFGGNNSGSGEGGKERKGLGATLRHLGSRGSSSKESSGGSEVAGDVNVGAVHWTAAVATVPEEKFGSLAPASSAPAIMPAMGLMEVPLEPSFNKRNNNSNAVPPPGKYTLSLSQVPGLTPIRTNASVLHTNGGSESTLSDSPKHDGNARMRKLSLPGMMKKLSRTNSHPSQAAASAVSPLSEDSTSPSKAGGPVQATRSQENSFREANSRVLRNSSSVNSGGFKGGWLGGSGDTPLIKAIKAGDNQAVLEVLSSGADPNQLGKGMMKQGDTPLIKASKRGNVGAVQLLLKFGALPNVPNRKGNTPLELVVEKGNMAMVQALLLGGADANTCTSIDLVPLVMLAAWNGSEEVVRALLNANADVNANKPKGGTALHSAALQGFETIVSLLLGAGADVHKRNQDNSTPLFNAAMKGHTGIVRMLVKAGSDVNTAGKDNMVPLEVAIEGDHFYVVRELVEAGASVNAQTYEADAVPMIMLAAWKGNKNIVKLLVSKGADVNQKKTGGGTALHAAALQGHADIVWLLLMAGAQVHARNQDGNTPLHNAARKGHLSTVVRLLEGQADPNAQGKSRMTPLHSAVAEVGNADVVKLLLKAGADTSCCDKNGWHPLHYAAANDLLHAAELLVQHPSCQVNAPEGIDNQTPLFIAAKSGHAATAKALLKSGANPMSRTKVQGNTPLHAAMVGEHLDTIRVLVRFHADPYAYNVDGTRPIDVTDHELCRKAIQAGLMDRRA